MTCFYGFYNSKNECMLVFMPANTKQINTYVSYERIYPRGIATCTVACVHFIKSYPSTFSYYISAAQYSLHVPMITQVIWI